eukprot:SAG11_NODE_2801_length_2956_cov_1.470774_2_plen_279_part_00
MCARLPARARAARTPACLQGMKSLRTVRVLRPLRAISRFEGMRIVIDALLGSAGELGNVGLILAVVWSVFAILGVSLFGGQFISCSGEQLSLEATSWAPFGVPGTICVGSFVDADSGEILPHRWERAYYNFDNFLQSMISLFVVSTREGWTTIMWNAMDTTDVGARTLNLRLIISLSIRRAPLCCVFCGNGCIQECGTTCRCVESGYLPLPNYSLGSGVFFPAFIMLGYYFCLNIFLGVIFDHFSTIKAQQGGSVFQTEQQRTWSAPITAGYLDHDLP